MLIRNATGFRAALRIFLLRNWLIVALILVIEVLSHELHTWVPALDTSAFSTTSVSMLVATLGLFLAFRFNEAYGRWWEARTLWGGMVNTSRSFGRQVQSYLTLERVPALGSHAAAAALRRELVHRQIAYVNAVRLSLRRQDVFPEIDAYLSPEEAEALRGADNPAVQLATRQSERLARLLTGTEHAILLARFDDSLTRALDYQGGMERIKNTAFPDAVLAVTRVLVWLVSLLIALAFVEPAENIYVMEFAAVLVITLSLRLINQMGEDLNDPFENRPNDTPMTALCRTIEIDLRQQLGETDLPEKVQPVGGVLL